MLLMNERLNNEIQQLMNAHQTTEFEEETSQLETSPFVIRQDDDGSSSNDAFPNQAAESDHVEITEELEV